MKHSVAQTRKGRTPMSWKMWVRFICPAAGKPDRGEGKREGDDSVRFMSSLRKLCCARLLHACSRARRLARWAWRQPLAGCAAADWLVVASHSCVTLKSGVTCARPILRTRALPQGPPSRPKAVTIVETEVCLEGLRAQSIGEENLAATSRDCVRRLEATSVAWAI